MPPARSPRWTSTRRRCILIGDQTPAGVSGLLRADAAARKSSLIARLSQTTRSCAYIEGSLQTIVVAAAVPLVVLVAVSANSQLSVTGNRESQGSRTSSARTDNKASCECKARLDPVTLSSPATPHTTTVLRREIARACSGIPTHPLPPVPVAAVPTHTCRAWGIQI